MSPSQLPRGPQKSFFILQVRYFDQDFGLHVSSGRSIFPRPQGSHFESSHFNGFRNNFSPILVLRIFSVPFVVFIKNRGGQTTSRQHPGHHVFVHQVGVEHSHTVCGCSATRGRTERLQQKQHQPQSLK